MYFVAPARRLLSAAASALLLCAASTPPAHALGLPRDAGWECTQRGGTFVVVDDPTSNWLVTGCARNPSDGYADVVSAAAGSASFDGQGTGMVCKINGFPRQGCHDGKYWNYWHIENGQWSNEGLRAAGTPPRGGVVGWVFGRGNTPRYGGPVQPAPPRDPVVQPVAPQPQPKPGEPKPVQAKPTHKPDPTSKATPSPSTSASATPTPSESPSASATPSPTEPASAQPHAEVAPTAPQDPPTLGRELTAAAGSGQPLPWILATSALVAGGVAAVVWWRRRRAGQPS